jgi:glutathione S-transferase
MRLYDYLPSQNAWKVRQLIQHLDLPVERSFIAIFDGAGQTPEHRARNPTGAVPVLELDDGRVIAESNAILWYLAEATPGGSRYLPADAFGRAKVQQWLSFEADYVQSSIATLRHWVQTGKDARRHPEVLAARVGGSKRCLAALNRALDHGGFLAGDYSIADIAVYAYVHLADEAGIALADYPAVTSWCARVRAEPGYLTEQFGYAIDPSSGREL